jgi:hypothetical protein
VIRRGRSSDRVSRKHRQGVGHRMSLNPTASDDFMTLIDAAAILGITPNTLRAQWKKGRIETEKRGRDRWIRLSEVGRYQQEVQRRSPTQVNRKGADPDPILDAEDLARLIFVVLQTPTQRAEVTRGAHAAIERLTAVLPSTRRRRIARLLEVGAQVVLADDRAATHAERVAKTKSATLVALVALALARERAG